MSQGPSWANNPLIVVTVAIAVLGLMFVPFRVWNTDHAAQFYGSFIAAFVAAGAVIGTTALSARLARQQRKEERREEMLSEATELRAWMDALAWRFEYVANVLTAWYEAGTQINVAGMRSNMSPDLRTELRGRFLVASRVPQPLGHHLVSALYRADGALDAVSYYPGVAPEILVRPNDLQDRIAIALYYRKFIAWQCAKLAQFLVIEGVIETLTTEEKEVLRAGHPPFVPPQTIAS